jgi:membrane associated rhomboid family serine protease
MFPQGSWGHILGNMLFLAVFGKHVEDAFGSIRYLVFSFAGGCAATLTQTAMTLLLSRWRVSTNLGGWPLRAPA